MENLSITDLILITYLQLDSEILNGDSIAYAIVPWWFQQKNQRQPFPIEIPAYVGPATGDILGRIANWKHDPIFDLPDQDHFIEEQNEALKAYQDQVNEWHSNRRQWEIAQNLVQFRAWVSWLSTYGNMANSDMLVLRLAGLPTINDYSEAI